MAGGWWLRDGAWVFLGLEEEQVPSVAPSVAVPGALRGTALVLCSASSVSQSVFTITEKTPTRAFSWLKAPTSAFTFKTLLRHYAKRVLTFFNQEKAL